MKILYISFISLCLFLYSAQSQCFAAEISTDNIPVNSNVVRAQINKIKTKRIIIANALLLNNAQKQKAREIYLSVIEKEAILIAQLENEKTVMKKLYQEENNNAERRNQRRIIYNLQKAIADTENKVDKDFKKILTHDQKVKFNRLKKEIIISDF